jgi:hypothetical protein
MGRKLARIAPVLRRVGLEVSDERVPGGNRARTKVIRWSEGADREAIREALGIADEVSF